MGKAAQVPWTFVFVVATAIALSGCAGAQNRRAILPSAPIAAPLKLCPVVGPPKDLGAKPGFVQFAVSVMDSSDQPVTGLKQSNFEVHDKGQIFPIQYSHEDADGTPTSIVIVMDLSGFMQGELVPHQSKLEAVQKWLPDALDRLNGCDEVAVLVFGGNDFPDEGTTGQTVSPGPRYGVRKTPIRLLQPFTTDHQLALERLADRTAYGPAPLYDAIQQGLTMLESAHYQNRVLIVITDGVDYSSAIKKEGLIASVNRSGAPVYAIGLGEPGAPAFPPLSGLVIPLPFPPAQTRKPKRTIVDTETLWKLAAANGGRLFIVPQAMRDPRETLIKALTATVADLDHGYAIGVVAPAGLVHPEIAVAHRPRMKVRAHVIHDSQ